ncbi:MAG: hypothetical protein CTY16_05415 [Methylobacter sp.]|nr:MAG: hypothetical protein CTY16_05415 [Methylobacter sp.]
MSIQTPFLKKSLTRLMIITLTAIIANICLYWLPNSIASFIYRSHLPTAPEKTLAFTNYDHARS